MQAVNTAIDGFITTARQRLAADPARRAAPQNLLEAMIVAADEPDSGIDDDQVAGNVLTMLLAGEDTTANTLSWCIWLLKQHPAALARAMAEVRGVMAGGGPVTLDHLAQLDYRRGLHARDHAPAAGGAAAAGAGEP
jgi:cytochrome P450